MTAAIAQHPSCLAYALSYAVRGWAVVPLHTPTADGCSCGRDCGSAGKHPRTEHGLKDATIDRAKIEAWWHRWPDANIGIVTGQRSRLFVVDIDPRSGGTESWTKLATAHDPLPLTVTAATGGGGTHLLYERPTVRALKSKSGALGDGLDVKADGGYIVAPPSLHVSGKRYQWRPGAGPGEADLALPPEWLWAPCAASRGGVSSEPVECSYWLLAAFREAGWLDRKLPSGGYAVTCPWSDQHTSGKDGDTSTVILPPTDLGEARFHCSHAHCSGRTAADVRAALPESAALVADQEHPLPPEAYLPDDDFDFDCADLENRSQPPGAERTKGPQRAVWQRYGAHTVAQSMSALWERLNRPEPQRSVSMCHRELDALVGGFCEGQVTVLGAVTSWGKSSYAIMVVDEAIRAGKRALLVTGEDVESTFAQRLTARRAGVSALRLRDGSVMRDRSASAAITDAVGRAEDVPWLLECVGKNAEWAAKAAGEIARSGDYDLLVFDYLQAFGCSARTQDRRNEVTRVARLFTDAAKTSGCAGLLLSQLRRRENANAPPSMHDLKESGDVENMAEVVLLGHLKHRETFNVGGADVELYDRNVVIGKNKNGPRTSSAICLPFDDARGGTAAFEVVT